MRRQAPARHADRPRPAARGGTAALLRRREKVGEQEHPDDGPQARGELWVARARPQEDDEHQKGTLPPSSQAARSSSFESGTERGALITQVWPSRFHTTIRFDPRFMT